MGDSSFILGGAYVAPEAWIERLSAVGVRVEVPNDLRPAYGGDFYVRLAHRDVTGSMAALVSVGLRYHALPTGAPAGLVERFEHRFATLLKERWPDSVLLYQATSLGWMKDGRAGVLRYFDLLREHEVEINEEIARYWSDPSAKLEQKIELWSRDFNLCSVLAEDVMGRAIADATGGDLSNTLRAPGAELYLTEAEVRGSIEMAREVPVRFDFSPEDAEQWPRFRPFVSWEAVRAEEEAEDADEEPETDEEPEEEETND